VSVGMSRDLDPSIQHRSDIYVENRVFVSIQAMCEKTDGNIYITLCYQFLHWLSVLSGGSTVGTRSDRPPPLEPPKDVRGAPKRHNGGKS
jgi:hypothetical protein